MLRLLSDRRLILLALLATMLSGGVFLLGPPLARYQEGRLASRLVADILKRDTAADPAELHRIAALGSTAIEPLVCAATSENAALADQARNTLDEQLARWQITIESAPNQVSHHLPVELARSLSEHVGDFGDLGQRWAERTALELVAIAETLPPHSAEQVLEDCTAILEVIPATGPRLRVSVAETAARAEPPLLGGEARIDMGMFATPSETLLADQPQPSGLAMPVPDTPPAASEPAAQVVPTPPLAADWGPDWSTSASERESSDLTRPLKGQDTTATKIPTSSAETPMLVAVPDPETMARLLGELRGQKTEVLLQSVQGADFYTVGVVRQVLGERGFSREELDLAQRIVQSKPGERLQLVRELRNVHAGIARRWLREFLTDEDPDVRLEALSVLAASSDPELVPLARELAVHDRDPRIADLATRILQDARK
jgi:hypothetical protein